MSDQTNDDVPNLFSDDNPEDIVNYLEELVGEDKKFKSVEDLAKGKAEADAFIKKLTDELAEVRKDLDTKIGLEEFLTKMKANEQNGSEEVNDGQPISDDPSPNANIEELVEQLLSKREQTQSAKANETKVASKLTEVYGDKAREQVQRAAEALGTTPAELQEIGRKNPSMLFRLMGLEGRQAPSGSTVPTSTVHISDNGTGGERNHAYYQNLKKENPKLYNSPKVQVAMHKDAMRLGERFFS